jgi:pimeloyl-ACP methyl ester carboxylesterase
MIERRHPARGKFLSVEGGRLHYIDQGQGDSLILLHGASANGQDFDASILPALAKHYRVIVPDRLGMGHSLRVGRHWHTPLDQANTVRELITHLGLDKPVLVAHSWSGALALAYLLYYPREISSVVLLSPAAHTWHAPAALYNRLTRWPLIGQLFTWLMVFPLGYLGLDTGIRSVFHRGKVPAGYRRRTAIDLLLRPRSWRANADDLCLLNPYLASQGRSYGWIRHPIMSIIGDYDTVVSNEIHTMTLKRQLHSLSVVSLAECGHAPHHEHPEAVCRLIRDFIESLGPTNS